MDWLEIWRDSWSTGSVTASSSSSAGGANVNNDARAATTGNGAYSRRPPCSRPHGCTDPTSQRRHREEAQAGSRHRRGSTVGRTEAHEEGSQADCR